MNLVVSHNLDEIRVDAPLFRAGDDRTRLLFINTLSRGFDTQRRQLQRFTAQREDVVAVHVDVKLPPLGRLLAAATRIPRRRDMTAFRLMMVWHAILGRWLNGPLRATQFHAVQFTTQSLAFPLPGLWDRHRLPGAVLLDATGVLEVSEFNASPAATWPLVQAERRIFSSARLVTAMSRWAAESLRRDYRVSEDRLQVAPGCVSLRVPQATPGRATRPTLLFVGHDWISKGGADLLDVHQAHLADLADLIVVCPTVRPDPSARSVRWVDRVPHDELVRDFFPRADALVLPTHVDCSPWVVLEAMAAGLPVFASRMGGIPEMVEDGVAGRILPAHDRSSWAQALRDAVSNRSLLARMGLAARHTAETRYDPDVNYHRLIDRLVGLRRRAGMTPAS